MSETFDLILKNVIADDWQLTAHGALKMNMRGVAMSDVLAAAIEGRLIEDRPDCHLGPALNWRKRKPAREQLLLTVLSTFSIAKE